MILDDLAAATRIRVAKDQKNMPLAEVRKEAEKIKNEKVSFYEQLKADGLSAICEVKKASPSKGIIAENFPYLEIAKEYESIGASCLSVLTEPEYFKGSDEYLKEIAAQVQIPVLRKDFTVDAYQIYQAKTLGASAVLLICALMSTDEIKDYLSLCKELSLDAIVETHDEHEVEQALDADARIIGINNRNLKDFTVSISNCTNLKKMIPADRVVIAESGIKTGNDTRKIIDAGIDAILVGETLMRSENRKNTLMELKNGGIR